MKISPDKKNKVDRFSEIRMEANLSYREAGKLLGIDPSNLCKIEQYKRQPSRIVFQKIEKVLRFQKKD